MKHSINEKERKRRDPNSVISLYSNVMVHCVKFVLMIVLMESHSWTGGNPWRWWEKPIDFSQLKLKLHRCLNSRLLGSLFILLPTEVDTFKVAR